MAMGGFTIRSAAVLTVVTVVLVSVLRTLLPRDPLFLPVTSSSPSSPSSHPIPNLMHAASTHYAAFLARQSTSLPAAVAEYERRYGRAPPKGFGAWFDFVRDNGVKVVDDYDHMVKDFEPFWALEGQEIRKRAMQVGQLPTFDLVRLQNGSSITLDVPKNTTYKDAERGARARGFRSMMKKFQHTLPDMDFPINALAESRVLVPWEQIQYSNLSDSEDLHLQTFTPSWADADGVVRSNVWDAFRRTCPPRSMARKLFGSVRGGNQGSHGQRPLSYLRAKASPARDGTTTADQHSQLEGGEDNAPRFITTPSFDFCTRPATHVQHGHFFSDWRTISTLVPVFSPAKAPGYSDLLIPSHYYYVPSAKYTYGYARDKNDVAMVMDEDKGEVAWEEKRDDVFWRGASTGGGNTPGGFLRGYQRHRFVELTASRSNNTVPVTFAAPADAKDTLSTAEQPYYTSSPFPISTLNADIMNTGFTRAVGCKGYVAPSGSSLPPNVPSKGCEALKANYHFTDTVPMAEHYRHKYLVDIDGMGYSARVMALLASRSAVVKGSVWREWWGAWSMPWLHYIPLSSSYAEIYDIYAFFSGPTKSMLEAAKFSRSPSPDDETKAERTQPRKLNQRQKQGDLTADTTAARGEPSHNDALLQRIALAGREWKQTMARRVDMEAYVYRLCLEYARLWADDREGMDYVG
ncbi:hypothetical protein JB92DRAFT_2853554 [Gautieria morchelliformis]|nr:hypothetical protein JB92DRAFT_2853554 [Gautieria morchelliformis]